MLCWLNYGEVSFVSKICNAKRSYVLPNVSTYCLRHNSFRCNWFRPNCFYVNVFELIVFDVKKRPGKPLLQQCKLFGSLIIERESGCPHFLCQSFLAQNTVFLLLDEETIFWHNQDSRELARKVLRVVI